MSQSTIPDHQRTKNGKLLNPIGFGAILHFRPHLRMYYFKRQSGCPYGGNQALLQLLSYFNPIAFQMQFCMPRRDGRKSFRELNSPRNPNSVCTMSGSLPSKPPSAHSIISRRSGKVGIDRPTRLASFQKKGWTRLQIAVPAPGRVTFSRRGWTPPV
jgi:hypothetical protein